MENKLDVLTKKLYEEGIEKARREAEEIIEKARQEAGKIVENARDKADQMLKQAESDRDNMKRKADSEMALSARQAIGTLKQSITNLISGEVSAEMGRIGFEEKPFVQELLMNVVRKWDVGAGNLDMELLVPSGEKAEFESLVASKYKNLLDKGLAVKVGDLKDEFVIQPKDGSYQISFSETLFNDFFNQYMRGFTKSLLFEKEEK